MERPLISVIVPIYNTEEFLARCIDSIIAQTYQQLEIILVDDGSKDNSGKICDAYALQDDRIRVFHIPNGGVSNARNIGLEAATGAYIVFVDSDDWVERGHIENLLPVMGEDMVCCGFIQYVNGEAVSRSYFDEGLVYRDTWMENFWEYWKIKAILPPWRSCYSAQILRDCDIRFDSGLYIGEDEQFNLQYFRHCCKVRFTEYCTYCYLVDDHFSAMQKYHSTRQASAIAICKAIEKITGEVTYAARWYHWHGTISHLNKWYRKKTGIERKRVSQKMRECFNEPFFRDCIPYIRKNGSLDEKVETFFMRRWLHPVFKPFYGIICFASNIKNRLLRIVKRLRKHYD